MRLGPMRTVRRCSRHRHLPASSEPSAAAMARAGSSPAGGLTSTDVTNLRRASFAANALRSANGRGGPAAAPVTVATPANAAWGDCEVAGIGAATVFSARVDVAGRIRDARGRGNPANVLRRRSPATATDEAHRRDGNIRRAYTPKYSGVDIVDGALVDAPGQTRIRGREDGAGPTWNIFSTCRDGNVVIGPSESS